LSDTFHQRLARLDRADARPLLRQLRRGIEKESLRVDGDGRLAQTPHPAALGSALTHPLITTDYSEALLEFITLVSADVGHSLEQLDLIHRFTYTVLDGEQLWNASMPCRLGGDDEIPVARYGTSNSARLKTIYRIGLGHRYGRHMQTIAGIHYNFSLPESLWPLLGIDDQDGVTNAYFALIRNFRRWTWLLAYLFGASPALSRDFLGDRPHRLLPLDDDTLHLPHATSLRMGDLGYQSSAQEDLPICYNSLGDYVDTLKQAILNPHPDYQRIGILVDGEYRQLSAGLLQIENEFYSPIRPKRVARRGETALSALAKGGVQYIEVRCLDINPFLPLGIDAETIHFLDAFLLYCVLSDSPACNETGRAELKANLKAVVNGGRQPGLQLQREGADIAFRDWAGQLLDGIDATAALLDRAAGDNRHRDAVATMRRRVADPQLTPSARLLHTLHDQHFTFAQFVQQQSRHHADGFRAQPLPPALLAQYVNEAERSLQAQLALESDDQTPFDRYLEHYFEQYRAL
jgi:glutamate--cysteine ligase